MAILLSEQAGIPGWERWRGSPLDRGLWLVAYAVILLMPCELILTADEVVSRPGACAMPMMLARRTCVSDSGRLIGLRACSSVIVLWRRRSRKP